jgi:palmitoyltransferase ZDHHC9/14/18
LYLNLYMQRNYRTFLIFIYITTVYCLYVFGVCLAQLFVRHRQLVDEAQAAGESTDGL